MTEIIKGISHGRIEWIDKPNVNDVAQYACAVIVKAARESIKQRGKFKIVLAGGTTPGLIYTLLARKPCHWKYWHFYLGDERCLPVDSPERNSHMVEKKLLTHIDVPKKNIHFIPVEKGNKKAASGYEKTVSAALPFDMVLLGMGEDGHTASLFPGQLHDSNECVHAVTGAPKFPAERVSLSADALSQNQYLLIIVTGASKRDSVVRWRKGENLPVSRISTLGKAYILLDSTAGSGRQ